MALILPSKESERASRAGTMASSPVDALVDDAALMSKLLGVGVSL